MLTNARVAELLAGLGVKGRLERSGDATGDAARQRALARIAKSRLIHPNFDGGLARGDDIQSAPIAHAAGLPGAAPHFSENQARKVRGVPFADAPSQRKPVQAIGKAAIEDLGKFPGGGGRPLSRDELETAKEIFRDKIDYSKVRIVSGEHMTIWGKILTFRDHGVALGNTIYFPNNAHGASLYSHDFQPDWYVHEMVHVYQYAKDGWSYAVRSIWEQLTKGPGAYRYELVGGKMFSKYDVEQQAAIVQKYYSGAMSPSDMAIAEKMLRTEGLLR
ncbi:MAG: hypothetical protein HY403_11485 [Elusimicrobia bacterium]|nr:hypothetical protein [Elusimicrobiota bacterium]